jgi:hypothetical protein
MTIFDSTRRGHRYCGAFALPLVGYDVQDTDKTPDT